MEEYIKKRLEESANVKLFMSMDSDYVNGIADVANAVVKTYRKKGKIVLFGNGGSASQAEHIAAEFNVQYEMKRPSLEAIALTANTSIVTAASNDFGYDNVFEKQVESTVKKKDIVIGLTTSGNSANVIKGLEKAKSIGAITVALAGEKGLYKKVADYVIKVPSSRASVIQEVHITIGHILCGLVEEELFGRKK